MKRYDSVKLFVVAFDLETSASIMRCVFLYAELKPNIGKKIYHAIPEKSNFPFFANISVIIHFSRINVAQKILNQRDIFFSWNE